MSNILIGNGLIGKVIADSVKPDKIFTSKNIESLPDDCTNLYCAAPSGNRVFAEQNAEHDRQSVDALIDALSRIRCRRIVLISTADTQVKPDSVYGHNRLRLEEHVRLHENHTILRLPNIVHHSISKNVLYDIKNNIWLEKINPNSVNQWFDLRRLVDYLDAQDSQMNLCSEPISTRQLLENFAPHILDKVDHTKPSVLYDLRPYLASKEDILLCMKEYLQSSAQEIT